VKNIWLQQQYVHSCKKKAMKQRTGKDGCLTWAYH
jgi:hypothetical protein